MELVRRETRSHSTHYDGDHYDNMSGPPVRLGGISTMDFAALQAILETDHNPETRMQTSNVSIKHVNYSLNKQKAIIKKLDSSNRIEPFTIKAPDEKNHIMIHFQIGFYEIVRRAIHLYYTHMKHHKYTCYITVLQETSSKMNVQVTYRIQTRSGGSTAYTLNLYHTKSALMANGRTVPEFINGDWPNICSIITKYERQFSNFSHEDLNLSIKQDLERISKGLSEINLMGSGPKSKGPLTANPQQVTHETPMEDELRVDHMTTNLPLISQEKSAELLPQQNTAHLMANSIQSGQEETPHPPFGQSATLNDKHSWQITAYSDSNFPLETGTPQRASLYSSGENTYPRSQGLRTPFNQQVSQGNPRIQGVRTPLNQHMNQVQLRIPDPTSPFPCIGTGDSTKKTPAKTIQPHIPHRQGQHPDTAENWNYQNHQRDTIAGRYSQSDDRHTSTASDKCKDCLTRQRELEDTLRDLHTRERRIASTERAVKQREKETEKLRLQIETQKAVIAGLENRVQELSNANKLLQQVVDATPIQGVRSPLQQPPQAHEQREPQSDLMSEEIRRLKDELRMKEMENRLTEKMHNMEVRMISHFSHNTPPIHKYEAYPTPVHFFPLHHSMWPQGHTNISAPPPRRQAGPARGPRQSGQIDPGRLHHERMESQPNPRYREQRNQHPQNHFPSNSSTLDPGQDTSAPRVNGNEFPLQNPPRYPRISIHNSSADKTNLDSPHISNAPDTDTKIYDSPRCDTRKTPEKNEGSPTDQPSKWRDSLKHLDDQSPRMDLYRHTMSPMRN